MGIWNETMFFPLIHGTVYIGSMNSPYALNGQTGVKMAKTNPVIAPTRFTRDRKVYKW